MTISSTTVKNSYSGDGSTTTFTYTFKIFQDSDIQVIIRAANGTETIKTITTHYTVTGAGVSTGGTVVFTSGNIPTNTQTVVLRRNIPQTQAIDYIANDPFPAESHEEGLDRATMAIQQIQEEVTRSLKLSKTNTMTSTEFTVGATDRANKILAFDASGEISVTQELGTYTGNWSASTTYYVRDLIKDTSTGNIFICITAHTSSGSQPITSNADSAKWSLIVDNAAASANANAAANHASNSSNFANNSSNSANTAANHASNASNHASNASNHSANSSNFANNSSNHASNASNSANSSANSASNSSNFANNSSNSANSASNHSANASNFANNASNHASNSSNFANNSSNSANTSANHASNSSNHAANSSNFANNSSNSANDSSNHASNSSNHAANSSNFANNSSNHASNSSNFSNNSSNHASNSSNHSSNAANHASNAANSAAAAAASADTFDDVYLGSKASDPALDNDGDPLTAGDLYYNTTSSNLKYYTGSAWVAITSGGITDVVQDTTPQLGGNLDVNGNSIVSASNGNIVLEPNGTGHVHINTAALRLGDLNTEARISSYGTGNLVLTTNEGNDPDPSITIGNGANADITLTPSGTGDVVLSADTVKIGDANTDAVLTTDGTGDITISTNSGTNSGTVKIFDGANANIEITPNGTGVVKLDGLSYPTADGTANQVLKTDGSGVLSFTTLTSDGTADWDTSVKTTGFTATANKGYFCNTTSAAFTVTLPATPSAGDEIILLDYAGTFDTNALTISPNGGKIEGGTGNQQLTGEREGARLVYIDSTQGWLAYSGINEGTDALSPSPYSIDFLVVAGGASGGGEIGGGGGAGGYRTSTQTTDVGTVITVTVGDGGAQTPAQTQGNSGSNSSISGSGLTTITSTGGGGGGCYSGGNTAGSNGGSGGGSGAGGGTTPAGGSGNTPSTAPSQGNNGGASQGPNSGGGGGGASAVGSAGGTPGGNGGDGTASSITGSSVTRAGGGGGGTRTDRAGGTGGAGGGGNGAGSATNSTGNANTGSGGGGGAGPGGTLTGAAGGKGVVILSLPTASYSSTTTGSPTVTTSGSNTILQFNGSGSYTA